MGLNQYLLSPKFPEEFSSPELGAHSGKVECEPSVPLRAPGYSPWCAWPASPLKGQTAMQGAESTPSEGVSCQLAMCSLFLASADDSLPGHLCFCFAGPRFVCISCWFVLLFAATARGLSSPVPTSTYSGWPSELQTRHFYSRQKHCLTHQ